MHAHVIKPEEQSHGYFGVFQIFLTSAHDNFFSTVAKDEIWSVIFRTDELHFLNFSDSLPFFWLISEIDRKSEWHIRSEQNWNELSKSEFVRKFSNKCPINFQIQPTYLTSNVQPTIEKLNRLKLM